ncbi:MAG: hypothetical protein CR972_03560 [Candidatus Moraniibacteriota bacterium]|nr:MAG: hypothetical protein CR972_03560 [Candidatus Moranbacteria bacterium]
MELINIKVEPSIILKQFEVSDIKVIFQVMDRNRDYLKKWCARTIDKYPNAEALCEDIVRYRNSKAFCLGIWDKKEFMGSINFTVYNDFFEVPRCVIGYWIDENHQGRGYIGKSLAYIVEYIFDTFDVHMIHAKVSSQNKRSINVLERAGFSKYESIFELEFVLGRNV